MTDTEKLPYKYCLVPCCTNTTVTSRDKLFFSVPKEPVIRKAWIRAMKRDETKTPKLSNKTSLWCCEDHFLLKDDMENFWQWNLTKDVKRLRIKAGVLPHIFACQKRNALPLTERKGAKKRKHVALVQEALEAASVISPSTSHFQEEAAIEDPVTEAATDKGIQVNLKMPFRSKGTNTAIKVASVACSPIKMVGSVGTHISPQKLLSEFLPQKQTDMSDDSVSDYDCLSVSSDDNYSSENEECANNKFKEHMIAGSIMSIEKEPKIFLGLPMKSFFLVKLLTESAALPTSHIYITLKKLRLNNAFSILAIDFGLSVSSISRIFSKSLPVLANLMQELIVWPSVNKIRTHLPIPFRARYGKVISIIDCLEIEKPSNPLNQALTWSNYYQCNTLKYLVSCTPDGLVTFISDGYGGRTSDRVIIEDCGYLEKLTPGTSIMADRGFKNISALLERKGCTLIRPPSVSASTVSTKVEVKQSKRIAALRIHVERVIGRLRDFKMLLPHACVDNHHIPIMDNALTVACGIINMQDHLIKKQI